jgi:putative membrane protein
VSDLPYLGLPPSYSGPGEVSGPGGASGYRLPPSPERLHPLSPLVRLGRAAISLVWVFALATVDSHESHSHSYLPDIGIAALLFLLGLISWAVTTWSVHGDVLEVATGLIRRKVVRLPLSRVQAVDVVEPWLARLFGLAEVRVRSGSGATGDARLQYLKQADAISVRNAVMALAHGLPDSTPEAVSWPLERIDNRVLVVSTLASRAVLVPAVLLAGAGVAASVGQPVVASLLGLYGAVTCFGVGRRVANMWGFSVSEAPDGLRVQTGVGSRSGETIPISRIQALRHAEPFLWRARGWRSLSVHLAGGVSHRRNQPRGPVRRALFPAGTSSQIDPLLLRVIGRTAIAGVKPPARARWRAPLSYHFRCAGHDGVIASSSWGRISRRTELIPLAKVQSVRYSQGPLSRALGLATVRLDAAGREAVVSFEFFDANEARRLLDELVAACAAARASARTAL